MLPEITSPVELVSAGKLNPEAVGWSRGPLHRSTALSAPGRSKRWEYWGVWSDEFFIGLTLADLSYAHLMDIYVLDRSTNTETVRSQVRIGPMRKRLSDALPPMTAAAGPLRFEDSVDQTRLQAAAKGIEVDVTVGLGHDALGVVVPWNDKQFQYTLKDLNRPATGTITIAGEKVELGNAFAVLDRGRGIWPYRMTWNWGTGNGTVDGVELGLQVGGKWTDGTGSTENGLFVNGRLHYWPDELTWEYDLADPDSPWRIRGPQVDAVLTPFHRRRAVTELGLLGTRIHQGFGTWTGWASDNDGNRYSLDGIVGWAEEARNRW